MVWVFFIEDNMERAITQEPTFGNSPKIIFKKHEGMLVTPIPGRKVRHVVEQLLADEGIYARKVPI